MLEDMEASSVLRAWCYVSIMRLPEPKWLYSTVVKGASFIITARKTIRTHVPVVADRKKYCDVYEFVTFHATLAAYEACDMFFRMFDLQ